MINLEVSIFGPKGVLFKEKTAMAVLPAAGGEIGVLHGHIPTITSLKFGVIKLFDQHNTLIYKMYVDAGVAKIENSSLSVVCSQCCQALNLDIADINQKIDLLKQLGNNTSKLEFYQQILLDISN